MERLGERLKGVTIDIQPIRQDGSPQRVQLEQIGGAQVNTLVKASKIIVIASLVLWLVPALFTAGVGPHEIGVRQSAVSRHPRRGSRSGLALRVPGVHKLIRLPSSYFMLDFTTDDKGPQKPLVIRTKDNNNVDLDVSVPVRIKPGEANALVAAGNHVQDPDGRYRYMRLAEETATSVLREEMASLDSVGFYSTDRRLAASEATLKMLNKQLAPMHLEAQAVLVRAVRFRDDYESSSSRSSSTSRTSCSMPRARSSRTCSRASTTISRARTRRSPNARRSGASARTSSSARIRSACSTSPMRRRARPARSSRRCRRPMSRRSTRPPRSCSAWMPTRSASAYLIGIKNIQAETLEYKNRVTAEADAIEGRLGAEGDAMVAKVQGEYETKLNVLLGSPAGKAYVA